MTAQAADQKPLAAILAGGAGQRLGRGPKALVPVAGQTLMAHVLARLRPQTRAIVTVVRAPVPWPSAYGLNALTDLVADAGPMAGVAAALAWAAPQGPLVLTCPVDVPFIPRDLVARLGAALTPDFDIAVVASGAHRHHLIALWRTVLSNDIAALLQNEGAVAVHRVQARVRTIEVSWPVGTFDPFFNINTPDDLTAAEHIASVLTEQREPT